MTTTDAARGGVWSVVVAAVLFSIPLGMVLEARSFVPAARYAPWLVGIPTTVLAAINLAGTIRDLRRPATGTATDPSERRTWRMFAWLGAFSVSILALGQLVGSVLFVIAFIRVYGRDRWLTAVLVAVGTAGAIELLFGRALKVPMFDGLLLGML